MARYQFMILNKYFKIGNKRIDKIMIKVMKPMSDYYLKDYAVKEPMRMMKINNKKKGNQSFQWNTIRI